MKNLKIFLIVISFLSLVFLLIPEVEAGCTDTDEVDTNRFTISADCSFDGTLADGIDADDAETSTNSAILNLVGETTLTIPAEQTFATGRIVLSDTASIVIMKPGKILLKTPVYMTDEDDDHHPASASAIFAPNANDKRKYTITDPVTPDCNDITANGGANVFSPTTCYIDIDDDDYTDGSVNCTNNASCSYATYGGVGTNTPTSYSTLNLQADAGTAGDCNDSGTDAQFVYTTQTCYIDADNDGYGSTTSKACVGKTTQTAVAANCSDVTHGSDATHGAAVTAEDYSNVGTDCLDTGKNSQYVYNTLTCYQDGDNDGYGSTTPSTLTCFGKTAQTSVTCETATYTVFGGTVFTIAALGVDIATTDNDCNDSLAGVYPGTKCFSGGWQDCSVCAEDGSCDALAAGDYDLAACQKCNGVSLDVAYYPNNQQDDNLPNRCIATCKKCNGSGSCVNQTAAQDIFGQCTGSTATTARLHQAATTTCNAKCASYTHENALCSGTSAACATTAESCVDVGYDTSGTNNVAVISVGGNCVDYAAVCGTAPGGGTQTCFGYTTPWVYCRCTYDSR